MHNFRDTIHIDRPRAEVWPYLVEPEKLQMWVGFESLDQLTEGPIDKGTRFKEAFRFLGKRVEMVDEITDLKDYESISWRASESPIPTSVDQHLVDEDGGTRVEFSMRTENAAGFFGKIAEPVVTRLIAKEVHSQLDRLKELAEADA